MILFNYYCYSSLQTMQRIVHPRFDACWGSKTRTTAWQDGSKHVCMSYQREEISNCEFTTPCFLNCVHKAASHKLNGTGSPQAPYHGDQFPTRRSKCTTNHANLLVLHTHLILNNCDRTTQPTTPPSWPSTIEIELLKSATC